MESTSVELCPRKMTHIMDIRLRALTVNADNWDDLILLDTVRRLYQPGKITFEHRIELARRFNQYYPEVRHVAEIQDLAHHIRQYQEDLYVLGVHDREIARSLSSFFFFSKFIRLLLLGLLWGPLALIGLWIHLPFALVISQSATWLAPRKDVLATTKFLAGVVTLLGLYLAGGGLVYLSGGEWYFVLLTPIMLALSGFATLKFAERGRALWRLFWVWNRCWSAEKSLKDLRRRRINLKTHVKSIVDLHIPADLDRLFYTKDQENPESK